MAFTLALACAPELRSQALLVRAALPEIFPGLQVDHPFAMPTPHAAYDTARGWYDAAFLLDTALPTASACDATLWLMQKPLGTCWSPWMLGAARPGRALVSTLRLATPAAIVKVAGHEVGHLLGLPHCPEPCLMRVAAHESRLAAIPPTLCPACRQRLAKKTGAIRCRLHAGSPPSGL